MKGIIYRTAIAIREGSRREVEMLNAYPYRDRIRRFCKITQGEVK